MQARDVCFGCIASCAAGWWSIAVEPNHPSDEPDSLRFLSMTGLTCEVSVPSRSRMIPGRIPNEFMAMFKPTKRPASKRSGGARNKNG